MKTSVMLSSILYLFKCRTPVLQKDAKPFWELVLNNSGLVKDITETIEKSSAGSAEYATHGLLEGENKQTFSRPSLSSRKRLF
jgi:hypothetical protein